MTARRILVTGFDPFDTYDVNTSQGVAEFLGGKAPADFSVATRVLPTAYGRSVEAVRAELSSPPDAVLMFGVAHDIDCFSIETVARNVRSMSSPDNDGVAPDTPSIDPTGPATLAPVVDTPALLSLLVGEGIDAVLSDDAGDYLCNFAYYTLLGWIDTNRLGIPALFVHVPDLSQADSVKVSQLHSDAATLLRFFARLALNTPS